ncbi:MAG: putative phosphoribosyl transferase [Bryobacterales bacterium]|nr:putative phosphoribosyl transferase [Bryobacterales bacterium]
MLVKPLFRDRVEAGQVLAQRLKRLGINSDPVVLALPRGGVPVGFEIAQALHAPLDVLLVRKLGVPGQEELALGAIASGGFRVLNKNLIEQLGLPPSVIDGIAARERQEIERRERLYRGDRPPLPVAGRTVILVDDGLATGATMLAAARAVRAQAPKKIIVAVPVASREACEELRRQVDEAVCAETPDPFYAVGAWYEDFSQTSDDEVRELLERAAHERIV